MRILLCLDGSPAGRLLDAALPLLSAGATWLPVHVVDARGPTDLRLLRAGVPGSGILPARQSGEIEAAVREAAQRVVQSAQTVLSAYGLPSESARIDSGEPGRVICAIAAEARADLVVLRARRHAGGPTSGPHSVGHTARFVVDHAPCPVLLVRGSPKFSQ
jgi:nucleotide-binding universal stress UspA family protein